MKLRNLTVLWKEVFNVLPRREEVTGRYFFEFME